MLRHEAGHLVLDPVFASIAHRDDDADCFIAIDIDDCDCDLCSKDRGPIPIYSTVSIGLVAGKNRISQRVTAKEAKKIAKTLLDYAKIIESMSLIDREDLS